MTAAKPEWVWVPINPTEEMIEFAQGAFSGVSKSKPLAKRIYSAMLAASPPAPSSKAPKRKCRHAEFSESGERVICDDCHPSVPDVAELTARVRECVNKVRGYDYSGYTACNLLTNTAEEAAIELDRMAAALVAQAKELQQAAQAGIDFGVKLAAERATVTELRAENDASRFARKVLSDDNDYLRNRNAVLAAEVERLKGERDLALAHDTQPYPTADAYEKVCAARTAWEARATTAEQRILELQNERTTRA